MPIELRQSDVMAQAAQSRKKISNLALTIFGDVYEAQRVSQVNQGLAFFEQSFFEYEQELSKRQFDVPLDDAESMALFKSTTDPGGTVPKPLGEANWGSVEKNYADYVDEQLEYVNKTFTNRKARQELVQHLQAGSVAHKRRVQNSWEEAADHTERASLNQLIEAVMQSNVPWERKVSEVSSRVDAMVKTGRLWKDEGEKVKREITAAAQYSHTVNGTMDAMKNGFVYEDSEGKEHIVEPGINAGEAWLNINTPFYDGNPDAKAKILSDVRREYKYVRETEDEQLDRDFSNMHIGADSLDKVDQALASLAKVEFYDGDMKYTWEQRFMAKRQNLINLMDLPEEGTKSIEDYKEDFGKRILVGIYKARAEGILSPDIRREMVDKAYWNYTEDENGNMIHSPNITEDDWVKFQKLTDAEDDSVFNEAIRNIKSLDLEPDEELRAVFEFREVYEKVEGLTPDKVREAVKGITEPYVIINLFKTLQRGQGAEAMFGTSRVLTALERFNLAIESGELMGVSDKEEEYLDINAAMLLELAQELYPKEQIKNSFADTKGKYKFPLGTAILSNTGGTPYVFKIEKKQAVLYRLGPEIDPETQRLKLTRLTSTSEIGKEKAKSILETKRQQETETTQKIIEKSLEASAEVFTGEMEGINLDDWKPEGQQWRNKKTGEIADYATARALHTLEMRRQLRK